MRWFPQSNLARVLLLLGSMVLVAHLSFFFLVDHFFVRMIATNRGEHVGRDILMIDRTIRQSEVEARDALRVALLEDFNYRYSETAPQGLRLRRRLNEHPSREFRESRESSESRGARGPWGPAPSAGQRRREHQRLFEQGLQAVLGTETRLYMRRGLRGDRGAEGWGPWFWIETGLDELPWVGIPTHHLHADAPQVLIYWLLVLGAILFLAAAIFVRLSNRPLELLVDAVERFGRRQDPPEIPEVGSREIRSLTHAFKKMASDIAKVNQDREMMLAGISHDLRSPLARMAVALEMGTALPGDLKRSMEEDLEDMDAIVEQFLTYVRSGEEEESSHLDLVELMREVAERTRRANECDGCIIDLDLPASLSIQGKPTTLKRLLQNLLDNALRYGGRKILVSAVREGAVLILAVEDDGPGVTADRVDEVFAPFARGERARTQAGTGLGLAIVKRIVEGQGGSIAALNRTTGGLRVEVRLPI